MEDTLSFTEVNFAPVKESRGLIGFASGVLNGHFFMGDIAIFIRKDGTLRFAYPDKKVGSKIFNIYYPINKTAGRIVQEAILVELDKLYPNRFKLED